ncbi:MAG: cytochrome-c oxidase, cbb3-type subunit III [Proteobacteria bacterium]|nr:cytochrome-c oxidase, cbb3-type subunit III [Pseudomonadota bacterium]
MAEEHKHVDALTGTATTGHEWDGLRELNTPLPRWWLWLFYLTIVWAIGYWIVYPAWPLISNSTQGLFGYHSRNAVVEDLNALHAQRGPMMAKLAAVSTAEILADPQLLDFARAQGRVAFADNCAPCHGAGGGGAKGYPNLNDDDWLWGGKIGDIEQTIRFGARAGSDKGRQGNMPPFTGVLKPAEISNVADYVRSLSGLTTEPGADLAAGKKVFADNCAVCHGDNAKGNRELGSANLTDRIWLYGSDKATIVEGIEKGHGGVMPNWEGRLSEPVIKSLAVYVYSFGGGEK